MKTAAVSPVLVATVCEKLGITDKVASEEGAELVSLVVDFVDGLSKSETKPTPEQVLEAVKRLSDLGKSSQLLQNDLPFVAQIEKYSKLAERFAAMTSGA